MADRLLTALPDPLDAFAAMGNKLGAQPFEFDEEVSRSERETGFRNAALANFIKSFGEIDNDIEAVLALYCHHCAIVANCEHSISALMRRACWRDTMHSPVPGCSPPRAR